MTEHEYRKLELSEGTQTELIELCLLDYLLEGDDESVRNQGEEQVASMTQYVVACLERRFNAHLLASGRVPVVDRTTQIEAARKATVKLQQALSNLCTDARFDIFRPALAREVRDRIFEPMTTAELFSFGRACVGGLSESRLESLPELLDELHGACAEALNRKKKAGGPGRSQIDAPVVADLNAAFVAGVHRVFMVRPARFAGDSEQGLDELPSDTSWAFIPKARRRLVERRYRANIRKHRKPFIRAAYSAIGLNLPEESLKKHVTLARKHLSDEFPWRNFPSDLYFDAPDRWRPT